MMMREVLTMMLLLMMVMMMMMMMMVMPAMMMTEQPVMRESYDNKLQPGANLKPNTLKPHRIAPCRKPMQLQ